MTMEGIKVSAHARKRCQQRGIPAEVLRTVLGEADRAVPVGSGAVAISLSKHRQHTLSAGGMPAQIVERAASVRVIIAGDGIVTVMHDHGRKGRRYRRGDGRSF